MATVRYSTIALHDHSKSAEKRSVLSPCIQCSLRFFHGPLCLTVLSGLWGGAEVVDEVPAVGAASTGARADVVALSTIVA